MELHKNTPYVGKWVPVEGDSPRETVVRTVKDTLTSEGRVLTWSDDRDHSYDVELANSNEESNLYTVMDESGEVVADFLISKITRKSPILRTLGLNGNKMESDDEAVAFVKLALHVSTTPSWSVK